MIVAPSPKINWSGRWFLAHKVKGRKKSSRKIGKNFLFCFLNIENNSTVRGVSKDICYRIFSRFLRKVIGVMVHTEYISICWRFPGDVPLKLNSLKMSISYCTPCDGLLLSLVGHPIEWFRRTPQVSLLLKSHYPNKPTLELEHGSF
jgi:hypothetical protein